MGRCSVILGTFCGLLFKKTMVRTSRLAVNKIQQTYKARREKEIVISTARPRAKTILICLSHRQFFTAQPTKKAQKSTNVPPPLQ